MCHRFFFLLAYLCGQVHAEVKEDLVNHLPGFDFTAFKVYSGYLEVPGPINGYDSLSIQYLFSHAQTNPLTSPVVAWHSGGPGASSIAGGLTMMSFFRVADDLKINPHAWNNVANMLYLESPAGAGREFGFSKCLKLGKAVPCSWNDVTQGEAYAHTLLAFFKAFPEFSSNPFYLAGESYFGQYGPNIANSIIHNRSFSAINLKGLLVGNGCWGGTATSSDCDGPNSERNDLDNLFGKGMISKKSFERAYIECGFDHQHQPNHTKCEEALSVAHAEVGPYNYYDVYDNCPDVGEYLRRSGKDMRWLLKQARAALVPSTRAEAHANLLGAGGGYTWDCGSTYSNGKVDDFVSRKDVQKALHLKDPGQSSFQYESSGPASIVLYPDLAKNIRILIFNGDADACIPYNGNEEWLQDLENQGVLQVAQPTKPWFVPNVTSPAAGAVTEYNVVDSDQVLTFVTVRLAGHMVPLFRPDAALTMLSNFLQGGLTTTTTASDTSNIIT